MNNAHCPFCHSNKLEIMQVMFNTFTRCQKCGARGPIANDVDEALNAWNKREVTMLTKYVLFIGLWFVVMLAIGLWGSWY